MKKTPKKLLGLAGLLFVIAMTVFAVFLPEPEAVATNSSITDTIIVRVIAATPNVDITGPKSGQTFVNPEQTISYTYENIETGTITLEYTDQDGNTITKTLATITPSGQAGSGSLPINLLQDYGYGDFVIKITGTGSDGVVDEDMIKFSFLPITGEGRQVDEKEEVKVDLDYDENNDDIDYIEINVYDENGDPIRPLSPVRVKRPNKTAILPFDNLPTGKYTLEITAFDKNGDPVALPYKTYVDYIKPDDPVIPVPNTGGGDAPNTGRIFGGLDISDSDHLITGLIIFFLVAICSVVVISKRKDDKKHH